MDEVLAVGDALFAEKCLKHLGEVAKQGRTIILVSHNLRTVEARCTRAIWIDQGRIAQEGKPSDVISAYLDLNNCSDRIYNVITAIEALPDDPCFRLKQAHILQQDRVVSSITIGQSVQIRLIYDVKSPTLGLRVSLDLRDQDDVIIFRSYFDSDGDSVLQLNPGKTRIDSYNTLLTFLLRDPILS